MLWPHDGEIASTNQSSPWLTGRTPAYLVEPLAVSLGDSGCHDVAISDCLDLHDVMMLRKIVQHGEKPFEICKKSGQGGCCEG